MSENDERSAASDLARMEKQVKQVRFESPPNSNQSTHHTSLVSTDEPFTTKDASVEDGKHGSSPIDRPEKSLKRSVSFAFSAPDPQMFPNTEEVPCEYSSRYPSRQWSAKESQGMRLSQPSAAWLERETRWARLVQKSRDLEASFARSVQKSRATLAEIKASEGYRLIEAKRALLAEQARADSVKQDGDNRSMCVIL